MRSHLPRASASVVTAAAPRPVSVKLDEELEARVKRLADARHRTARWLMREAITQHVDREEKREALRRDTLNAWEERAGRNARPGQEHESCCPVGSKFNLAGGVRLARARHARVHGGSRAQWCESAVGGCSLVMAPIIRAGCRPVLM
ncbi:MAG TPA: ribbon-helix-helix domain-containing protein [Rubrivivax sp.]|nr:ribbon-helix-helix domain-containing protein [Rubrivivax sp.]